MNAPLPHDSPAATGARPTQNLNVAALDPLVAPSELEALLPLSDRARQAVLDGRRNIEAILRGEDPRLLVVVGPCSIHDPAAAMEYAQKLVELKRQLEDRLVLVMRVYFEKPRTTVGWKGLINDPHLDGSFDITHGLKTARQLLLDINELGLPTATEFLDPVTPQYLDDLVSWAAIGARTTESQTHRQMASGLSMPVGFKNATNGSLQVALDAMQAALSPHHFIGVDDRGRACVVHTRGNAYGHVILRGGAQGSNYHPQDIANAAEQLTSANMNPLLMVDCSHANSGKKFAQQEVVWDSLVEQRAAAAVAKNSGGGSGGGSGGDSGGDSGGGGSIIGVMIESNLTEGKQSIPSDLTQLKYGVSVTDECIGWETTAAMLQRGYDRLPPVNG